MHKVALLHGFGGAPDAWRAVIDAWPEPRPRFHVPALPGHATTMPADASAGFSTAVARIAADLPADWESGGLIGYSLGARLSLGLAVHAPSKWRRVTLIGVNPGLPTDDAGRLIRAERHRTDNDWANLLATDGPTAFFSAWQRQPLFATQAVLPAEVRAAQQRWRSNLDGPQLAEAMRQMSLAEMPDYRSALAELPMPIQLIVGARDDKFLRIADAIHSRRPDARLDVVPNVGHNVVLEAPAALARVLADFHRPEVDRR